MAAETHRTRGDNDGNRIQHADANPYFRDMIGDRRPASPVLATPLQR